MLNIGEGTGPHTASGWRAHPEVKRFESFEGRRWLVTVHEFTRLVMDARWPGNHSSGRHPTPVTGAHYELAVQYLRALKGRTDFPTEDGYLEWLQGYGYPVTTLDHGTPWERDGVSLEWYLEHQEDWSPELVQQIHVQAESLVEDPATVGREAEVGMGGDGRPHLVASSYEERSSSSTT